MGVGSWTSGPTEHSVKLIIVPYHIPTSEGSAIESVIQHWSVAFLLNVSRNLYENTLPYYYRPKGFSWQSITHSMSLISGRKLLTPFAGFPFLSLTIP